MRSIALAAFACLCAPFALAQDADPPDPTADAAQRAAMAREFRLTPAMIEDLARRYYEKQQATGRARATYTDAVPRERRINMRFAPGDATPILEVAPGFPSVPCFFDATGQPWPLAQDVNSNPAGGSTGGQESGDGFTITRPMPGGNCLVVSVQGERPIGGIVAFLRDAPAPLAFKLAAGRGSYDAKLSVHVASRGPNARVDMVVRADTPETGAPYMMEMLQGITPPGAKPLIVSGASADEFRAWKLGQNVYLRTTHALVAPEPDAYQNAEGGLRVYSIRADRNGRAYDDMALLMSDGARNFTVRVRGN